MESKLFLLKRSIFRNRYLYVGCDIFSHDYAPPKHTFAVCDRLKMFSGSVDAGFILALRFYHGDPEPDCVGVSTSSRHLCEDNKPGQGSRANM